jgi:hypothetical protein
VRSSGNSVSVSPRSTQSLTGRRGQVADRLVLVTDDGGRCGASVRVCSPSVQPPSSAERRGIVPARSSAKLRLCERVEDRGGRVPSATERPLGRIG